MMAASLQHFREPGKLLSTPLLKDLYKHITPQYAADWKVIGTLLGLSSGELKSIEAGYPTNVKWCCDHMLKKWLEVDTSASWEKLLKAIDSPAVCSVQVTGGDEVSTLCNHVCNVNLQARFSIDDDTWPQDHPKIFVPPVLLYFEGHRTIQQTTAIARIVQTGEIDSLTESKFTPHNKPHQSFDDEQLYDVFENSTITRNVADILIQLGTSDKPQFILIEGPPGIGKTVLLQEIAYIHCSSCKKDNVLASFNLVLFVTLRDPYVQQAQSIYDLLCYFCEPGKIGTEMADASHRYFSKNGGKDLLFLFDGFDEFPLDLRKGSLIYKILNRRILPKCGIVVSSRPHASEDLHKLATLRVDILGFGKAEKMGFLKEALKGQESKIQRLTGYLTSHLTINGLCFVPFNLVAMLYLYKQVVHLPKNSVDLYKDLICVTIRHNLPKSGHQHEDAINDLDDLPEPCNRIIKQLSKLAYDGLCRNELIFSSDEVKAACPDIHVIPGAMNGFGLLQAVKHFCCTEKKITFNFIHFSIQEFLAAYYVISLSQDQELLLLQEKFWTSHLHYNMFAMYTSLTKGRRPAFKFFLEQPSLLFRIWHYIRGFFYKTGDDAVTISGDILNNPLKCIRLFRYFYESDQTVSQFIQNAKIFDDKRIDLSSIKLTDFDIDCLTLFLTCSNHKQWNRLQINSCNIQDHGLHVVHRGLQLLEAEVITVAELGLHSNGLTQSSSSNVSDIVISCGVEKLVIAANNHIGEDKALYTMLSDPSSRLQELDMEQTKLSTDGAIELFTALEMGKKLNVLYINDNEITDSACDAIASALSNTSLVKLWMGCNHKINSECILQFLKPLRDYNNTLEELELPNYPENDQWTDGDTWSERISFIQDYVNQRRVIDGCHVELEICYGT